MVNKKNRINKMFSIAIVLLFATSALYSVQTVKAVDMPTYLFMVAAPNPVGIGQTTYVTVFLDRYPPSRNTPTGYVLDAQFQFVVKITDPSGNVQTKNLVADFIGGASFSLTPTTLGTYTLDATFTQNSQTNNTYLSSSRTGVKLVVQQEPIPQYPGAPLPTEYWQRPIDSQNREWYSISSNWYGSSFYGGPFASGRNNWVKIGSAPNSAHILWTKPMDLGGLTGGELGDEQFYGGMSYERKWSNAVVIDGYLFYGRRLGSSSNLGTQCVDLKTGEEIWFQNGTIITCGQVLAFDTMNQHGTIAYLWQTGSTYNLFDAFTGIKVLQISNASTGRMVLDAHGNLLVYVLNGQTNRLTLWNSTKCIGNYSSSGPDYWRPVAGANLDWNRGIMWNVSVPDVPGSQSIATTGDSVIIAGAQAATGIIGMTGYSMVTGAQLWNFNVTSSESATYFQTSEVDGKFAWFKQETMTWYGYNALTGAQLWVTQPYANDWGLYTSGGGGIGASSPLIAYGKLYAAAYDGLHCFDMANGNTLWTYSTGNAGFETPYGTWALGMGQIFAADGKIYASCGEHSPGTPLWRGQKLVCVDATSGKEVWNALGWDEMPILADGCVVTLNTYDTRIYCFGKGPSATTVSAPTTTVPLETGVLIQGTVTDVSAGAKQSPLPERFPNGVPAMSDANMGSWMAYLYMQQPKPTNATGVTVFLQAMKSDGTVIDLWHATTDLTGHYQYTWTPQTADTYKIIATFEGSEAYWPSTVECGVSVGSAPPTPASASDVASAVVSQIPTPVPVTPVPTAPSASDVASQVVANLPGEDNTLLYAVIAIVIIALLIGIVNLAVLMMRRKQAA
jgi:hypothetical protein